MENGNKITIFLIAMLVTIAALYAVIDYKQKEAWERYHPAVVIIGHTNSVIEGEQIALFDIENFEFFNGSSFIGVTADYVNWTDNNKPFRFQPQNFSRLAERLDYFNASTGYIFDPDSVMDNGEKDYLILDMKSFTEIHGKTLGEAMDRYLLWITYEKEKAPVYDRTGSPEIFKPDFDYMIEPELNLLKIHNQTVQYWLVPYSYTYKNRAGTIRELIIVDAEEKKSFRGIISSDIIKRYTLWRINEPEAERGK